MSKSPSLFPLVIPQGHFAGTVDVQFREVVDVAKFDSGPFLAGTNA
jgi:hypothetical protein